MFSDLKDKVAIVTGGASGIGAETVKLLSSLGVRVISADMNNELNKKNAEDLKRQGMDVTPIYNDVRSIESIKEVVAYTKEKFNRIDILVNNAGIGERKSYDKTSIEEWDRVIETNLRSVMFYCLEVIPVMKNQKHGRIINVSSMAAKIGGLQSGTDYVASKAGIIGVTMNLAKQVGSYGINVNGIAPGVIHTPMTASYSNDVTETIPLRRKGTPEDVADSILFLVSGLSSYITGVTLDVNGGLHM